MMEETNFDLGSFATPSTSALLGTTAGSSVHPSTSHGSSGGPSDDPDREQDDGQQEGGGGANDDLLGMHHRQTTSAAASAQRFIDDDDDDDGNAGVDGGADGAMDQANGVERGNRNRSATDPSGGRLLNAGAIHSRSSISSSSSSSNSSGGRSGGIASGNGTRGTAASSYANRGRFDVQSVYEPTTHHFEKRASSPSSTYVDLIAAPVESVAPSASGSGSALGHSGGQPSAVNASAVADDGGLGGTEDGIVHGDGEAAEMLDVTAFSRWLTCLCVITFDLELGQSMEYMYPPTRLTDLEKANICYLSFPDSNSGCMGDTVFSFRIRKSQGTDAARVNALVAAAVAGGSSAGSASRVGARLHGERSVPSASPAPPASPSAFTRVSRTAGHVPFSRSASLQDTGGSTAIANGAYSAGGRAAANLPVGPISTFSADASTSSSADSDSSSGSGAVSNFLYGHVFFRQIRDGGLKRGYFQKSVVIVSPYPYPSLYGKLVSLIAPEYFAHGRPLLEAASQNISRWPAPRLGENYELPILGHVLRLRIPAVHEKPSFYQMSNAPDHDPDVIHATLDDVNLYSVFKAVLPDLQTLWELVLVCEPIVVFSPSPAVSSNAVLGLISLINPLQYACDFRSYFTIHDSDFKEYTARNRSVPSAILGVTNPYFIKALHHWPNHVVVGEPLKRQSSPVPGAQPSGSGLSAAAPVKSFALSPASKRPKSEWKQCVQVQYKPRIERSKALLKQLEFDASMSDSAKTALLRQHFAALTDAFMGPLERYFASLLPLQRHISPWKHLPALSRFVPEDFLKSVEQLGPQVTSGRKGDWIGLYKAFLECPNFKEWHQGKQREANDRLRKLYLEKVCEADLAQWVQDKDELHLVDLLVRLREEMTNPASQRFITPAMSRQFGAHIDLILSKLPNDLRASLGIHQ
ncbi:hypothetical protein CAOG_02223 [Capsaspora owczarzaki ATCC 30864]|uniref:UDENN domain-containing protein n=1 Tax=Capsaspora owczarzaki (strain ATCC 30864) TaxID=595528 RepID=A0A0D2X1L5_CAPO3|nr:hypothetical protein CAOG_02223 [Capsaspora owczarzaki ATCC 30864]KJE91019.1 hypothetical protein CAOG_002223 [Capsaspora owczarzaki ATCC 30864]|eukprot:XP_004348973.2 hypothetical protein CAOG_02223 [Capsaspora owczarzaki ATCC 30864]